MIVRYCKYTRIPMGRNVPHGTILLFVRVPHTSSPGDSSSVFLCHIREKEHAWQICYSLETVGSGIRTKEVLLKSTWNALEVEWNSQLTVDSRAMGHPFRRPLALPVAKCIKCARSRGANFQKDKTLGRSLKKRMICISSLTQLLDILASHGPLPQ